MLIKQLFKITVPICLSFLAHPLFAATSANIEVSAIIEKGCFFQQSPLGLNFGSHASTSQEKAVTANISNAQETWKIECTPDVPVTISFGNGQNLNSSTQKRRLKHTNSAQYIDYALYRNASLSQPIGTASSNNSMTLKSTAQKLLLDFQIYGVVDLSQGVVNKMPGQYKDDVLITIAW